LLQKKVEEKKYDQIDILTEKIDRNVDKLANLINDFIQVEKIRQGRLEFNPEILEFDKFAKTVVKDLDEIIADHKIVLSGKTGNCRRR
jgi:signal transduction histidine kinase